MGARLQGFAKGLVIADKQIKALQAASSGFFKGASSLLKHTTFPSSDKHIPSSLPDLCV